MGDVRVWGVWDEAMGGWMWGATSGSISWSFERESLVRYESPTKEVREMTDYEIAVRPEIAAAVVALYDMYAARERLEAAKAQKIAAWGSWGK